jgi:hypothetical protein
VLDQATGVNYSSSWRGGVVSMPASTTVKRKVPIMPTTKPAVSQKRGVATSGHKSAPEEIRREAKER